MADSWNKYVPELISGDKQRRTRAFDELSSRLIEATLALPSQRHVQELSNALLESDDTHEQQVLSQVLTWINAKGLASIPDRGPAPTRPEKAVAEWFWKPLRSTSMAFRAWEHDRRRDEDALLELARFLSRERYPHVEFGGVPLDSFHWGNVPNNNLSAVVFLGRLGMYGKTATQHFFRANWFHFLSDQRPAGLGSNEFDPEYHRICQNNESKKDPAKYLTHEKNGIRTDYGLVQCYVVPHNVGEIKVIGLWGCSTLGTLAAVKWAIDLGKNNDPPPNLALESNTTLEALVKVQAATCKYPDTWKPEPIQLEQLHVGHERWDVAKKCWELLPSLDLRWESFPGDVGQFIISGRARKTKGLIPRIMNAVTQVKVPPGTVIKLQDILSQSDFEVWIKHPSTTGNRITDYSGGCIEWVGRDCLRINTTIKTC